MTPDQIKLADRATQIACAELKHFSLAEAQLEGIAIRSIELAREIECLASQDRPTATLTPKPSTQPQSKQNAPSAVLERIRAILMKDYQLKALQYTESEIQQIQTAWLREGMRRAAKIADSNTTSSPAAFNMANKIRDDILAAAENETTGNF